MPDAPANRCELGSVRTRGGDDTGPYPQLRDLLVSDAPIRATLGPDWPGDKAEADTALGLGHRRGGPGHLGTRG